jgi:hypothetical protein
LRRWSTPATVNPETLQSPSDLSLHWKTCLMSLRRAQQFGVDEQQPLGEQQARECKIIFKTVPAFLLLTIMASSSLALSVDCIVRDGSVDTSNLSPSRISPLFENLCC